MFFAILDRASGAAVGYAAYMRIEPVHRVIEVGSILYTPQLQRTPLATEAMYLMARHVFEDLGYRRYEWKCNALNAPSRRAALRFGFTFEGIFRQHMIVKGRNRDTAWFSMLDSEWPARKANFERWLDPSNFGPDGRQKVLFRCLMEPPAHSGRHSWDGIRATEAGPPAAQAFAREGFPHLNSYYCCKPKRVLVDWNRPPG